MVVVYEEVPLDELEYEATESSYFFPCPCGDLFQISVSQLLAGDDIATCPSCSLVIRVLFNVADLPKASAPPRPDLDLD
eukprot:GDKH01009075.1.p1 GENE.GDKH01009075.1~~GDKH01009075.1.p1  ORF type:complete len:79 (-),score=1.01 GDKH01009075.1:214-450(-)